MRKTKKQAIVNQIHKLQQAIVNDIIDGTITNITKISFCNKMNHYYKCKDDVAISVQADGTISKDNTYFYM